MAQAVKRLFPKVQVTIGPVDRGRILLRLQEGRALHPRGPRAHRGDDARDRQGGLQGHARGDAARGGDRAVSARWARTTRSRSSPASRRTRCRSTARASSSICAAARTCRRPGGSRPSSSPASPVPTGAATSATRCCSASTAPLSRRASSSRPIWRASRRRSGATIAAWVRSSTCFSFDPVAPGSPFFHPKGAYRLQRPGRLHARPYGRYGYEEVVTPQIFDTRAVAALRALRELQGQHVLLDTSTSASTASSR